MENQLRLKSNISEFDRYITQITAKCNLEELELAVGLRYLLLNDNVGKKLEKENHLRGHFDFAYKFDIDDWNCKFRIRYQNRNE